jgi:hypothetical protein
MFNINSFSSGSELILIIMLVSMKIVYDTQPKVETSSKELLMQQNLKEAQFPAGSRDFYHQSIQTGCGVHPTSCYTANG